MAINGVNKMKGNRFSEDLVGCRGKKFEFVKLGMMIEYDVEPGTIKIKYFDEKGNVIWKTKD